jgi:peptidoglycan/LPS O-acetylase OafA/YrhL
MNYMIQLDGLRFFALSRVAVFHWAPKDIQFGIPWNIEVQLFF